MIAPTPVSDMLSLRDFRMIAALLTDHTGIKLPEAKRLMLEGRLRKRALSAGFRTVAAYCAHVHGGGLAAELPQLIDAATTNKTDFFREPQHFDFLEAHILPALLQRRSPVGLPRIKLWSAACSNGAEPYTLAMILTDVVASQRLNFGWSILGTDISQTILADARQAVYPAEMAAPIPPAKRTRYVMRGGSGSIAPRVRIVPELRNKVRFERLNLMDGSYPFDDDFDVILLRNVLIYFERADQDAVVRKLCGHLRPGGYLMLGHAESMIGTTLGLRQVAPATFQVS